MNFDFDYENFNVGTSRFTFVESGDIPVIGDNYLIKITQLGVIGFSLIGKYIGIQDNNFIFDFMYFRLLRQGQHYRPWRGIEELNGMRIQIPILPVARYIPPYNYYKMFSLGPNGRFISREVPPGNVSEYKTTIYRVASIKGIEEGPMTLINRFLAKGSKKRKAKRRRKSKRRF